MAVRATLQRRFNIIGPPRSTNSKLEEAREAFTLVLSRLAEASSNERSTQDQSFMAAINGLAGYQRVPPAPLDMGFMSAALLKLRDTSPNLKHELVTRFANAIHRDSNITIEEAKVFRAIRATLDSPVSINGITPGDGHLLSELIPV